MTAENTSCEFDPHATSMGDEVAPEVYEEPLRHAAAPSTTLTQRWCTSSRSVFRRPSAWAS